MKRNCVVVRNNNARGHIIISNSMTIHTVRGSQWGVSNLNMNNKLVKMRRYGDPRYGSEVPKGTSVTSITSGKNGKW